MIKGIIFDLDGTIFDFHANDVIAIKKLCAYVKEKFGMGEDEFVKIFNDAKKIVKKRLSDGGSRHSRTLHCQIALELMNESPFNYAMEMNDVYWSAFFENMRPYDGVVEFLQSLKANNIKTAICTDMTAYVQFGKLKQLGIENLIDAIVTSQETGMEKPSPVMFNLVLEKLQIKASEAAYFGDSLERDIEGASNCGLKTFWVVMNRKVDESINKYQKIFSYRDISIEDLN